jgi:hypothetical protein
VPACAILRSCFLKHLALDQAVAVAKLNMRNFYVFPSLLIVLAIVIVLQAVGLVRVDLGEDHRPEGVLR